MPLFIFPLGKGDREASRVYLAERSAMEGKPWFSLWRAERLKGARR